MDTENTLTKVATPFDRTRVLLLAKGLVQLGSGLWPLLDARSYRRFTRSGLPLGIVRIIAVVGIGEGLSTLAQLLIRKSTPKSGPHLPAWP